VTSNAPVAGHVSISYRPMLEKNRNVFSLDLNVPSELPSVTVFGREFQADGAECTHRLAISQTVCQSDDQSMNE